MTASPDPTTVFSLGLSCSLSHRTELPVLSDANERDATARLNLASARYR